MRRGFTLPEMLVVILIVAVLSGMVLAGMNGAVQFARESRTRAIIEKIDLLVMEQWEDYRTRQVPIIIPAGVSPLIASRARLYAIRELMRMEYPERVTDLVDGLSQYNASPPISMRLVPGRWKQYRRMAARRLGPSWQTLWTEQHQGAECLYLIVSNLHDGDKAALDFFGSDEIGDVDGDGMKEILDGWGRPIEFLRWSPGFTTANGATSMLTGDFTVHPDPFDTMHADPRWLDVTATLKPYLLHPLILSAGRDGVYDIAILSAFPNGDTFRYSITTPLNDPYYGMNSTTQILNGSPRDTDGDGLSTDNITNHSRVE